MKRMNIARVIGKMQTAVRHLAALRVYGLLLAVANYSLFTINYSLLTSCSSDEATAPAAKKSTPVQLAGYVTSYEEAQETDKASRAYGVTRTWTPPTGYSILDDLSDKSISVYFTQNPAAADMEEDFFFMRGDKWNLSKDIASAGTYYLYGYIPYDESIRASVAPLPESTFDAGAKLTLENLPTITTNDICVIVGAKNGTNADNDNGLTTGQFAFEAKATGGNDKGSNFVFLLFDHLYSCINVRFCVDEDYDKLRTIKLKKLELQAMVLNEATGVKTPLKRKTKAMITLRKTEDGSSPLMYNGAEQIVFTPDETSRNADEPLFYSEDGQALTVNFSDFTGCFMSQGISELSLRSTYDVYDKKGNKIREGCTALNKIDIQHLFSPVRTASRGMKYTVKMIVNPTYLYVLSEPDLDNPTITLD